MRKCEVPGCERSEVAIIARVTKVHMTGHSHHPPVQSYELEPVVRREPEEEKPEEVRA